MINLIKTYDDTLDTETCDNIVSKFEQFENQHESFDDRGMVFTQLNMAKAPQIWITRDRTIYRNFYKWFYNLLKRYRCHTTTDAN